MIRKNQSFFLMIILMCVAVCASAQEKSSSVPKVKKCSCGFSSITQGGLAAGESLPQGLVQSISGIRYKEWFAGIGGAVDFYHFRTIPVFIDLRRYLTEKITTPFIYVDGGVNLPWIMEHEKPSYSREDFKAGWYFDAGLGYRLALSGRHGILLNVGYSEKNLNSRRWMTTSYCPVEPCPDSESFNYTFKRYVFKLGWQF